MDELVLDAQKRMDKSIDSLKYSFAHLRSARANPAILDGIKCDYYGEKMDIVNLCGISVPEPRQILVKPYSREDLKPIAQAIAAANIGINPQVEADAIRLIVPALTQEIRQQVAKQAKQLAEEAKVSLRNIRRDVMDLVKIEDTMSDDYKDRLKKDLEKVMDDQMKKVETLLEEKTKEIMTI